MYSPKTLIAAAAAIGLVQMCPAPPAVVAAVAGGAVSGAIAGGAAICTKYCPGGNKREVRVNSAKFFLAARDLPPGVSQESIDQCTGQLNDQKNAGGVVTISDVDESTVNVEGVPAACMNLATVLTGDPAQAGGPVPIPLGSDSLQYQGITVEDRQNLANALGA